MYKLKLIQKKSRETIKKVFIIIILTITIEILREIELARFNSKDKKWVLKKEEEDV